MKKYLIVYFMYYAVALLLFAGCHTAMADVLGAESWSGGTVQGWSCWDTVNETTVSGLSAQKGYLGITFQGLSMKSPPVEYMVKAGSAASSGVFTGNYFSNGVQYLSFRVMCEYESTVCAIIHGNGQYWRYQVPTAPTGVWVSVTVPVSTSALRNLCATNNSVEFGQALNSVDWIGITFLRNNTLNSYHCYVDDVTLCGAGIGYGAWITQFGGTTADQLPGADPNGNGLDNLSEWIAGTDPSARGAGFSLQSVSQKPDGSNGFTLQWNSVSGRQYQVWRTEDLLSGFASISDWIAAEPPMNSFTDTSATGSGPYFYKVKVRKE